MAVFERWNIGTRLVLMNAPGTLTTGSRKAVLFANGTPNDIFGDIFLTVHYDTTAPGAGTKVAELSICPGDNNGGSEVFPEGGDGTVGTNVDPQRILLVGAFESRSPSTSVDEVLVIPGVVLSPGNSHVVLKNTSGFSFHSTYTLVLKPYETQGSAT